MVSNFKCNVSAIFFSFFACSTLKVAQCYIILVQIHKSKNIEKDLAYTFMLKLSTAVILQATQCTELHMSECIKERGIYILFPRLPILKHKLRYSNRVRPKEQRE